MFGKLIQNVKKGESYYLVKEMQLFGKGCFLRCFDCRLLMITPHLSKKETKLKQSISPIEHLYVILRFLVTSDTFVIIKIA